MAIVGSNFEIRIYPAPGSLRPFVFDPQGIIAENTSLAGQITWQAMRADQPFPFSLKNQPEVLVDHSANGFGTHCVLKDMPPTHQLVERLTAELNPRHFATSIELTCGDQVGMESSLESLPGSGRYPVAHMAAFGTVYDSSGKFGIRTRPDTVRVSVSAPRLDCAIDILSSMAGIAL